MENNDRIIEEIRRYCDPYSLLAIRGKELIRIRCPFRIMLRVDYAGSRKGEFLSVDKIMITPDIKMVFIIEGKGFPASCCRIIL
jgi:hypothetical protein